MRRAIYWAVLCALLAAGTAFAMDRFDIVSTRQMRQMLDDRKAQKTDFILVNTLDEIIALHSSIPGSVNLPWSRIDELQGRLGTDRQKLIITYCMGYR